MRLGVLYSSKVATFSLVCLTASCGAIERQPFEIKNHTAPQLVASSTEAIPRHHGPIARLSGEPKTPDVRRPLPDERQVSLEIDGLPIAQALPIIYTEQLGMSVIVVGELDKPITWSSEAIGIEHIRSAAEVAISSAGYSIEYVGSMVIVTDESAPNEAARAFIDLKNTPPEQIGTGLRAAFRGIEVGEVGRTLLISGPTHQVTSASRMARALDSDEVSRTPWAIIRLPRVVAAEASNLVGTLGLMGDIPVEVFSLDGTGLVFLAGYSFEAVRAATELLQAFADGLRDKIVRTVEVDRPEETTAALERLYADEIEVGDLIVMPLAGGGAVSLRGEPSTIADVIDYVRGVEHPQSWVRIEAAIAETQRGSAVDRGVSLGFSAGGFTVNAGLGGSEPGAIADSRALTLGVSSGNFTAALSWLESDTRTAILATPSISVRSGAEATLNVGSQVPVLDTEVTNDEATSITQTITYRDTGVILTVAPNVLRDGRIAIEVDQEISNAVQNTFSTVDSPVFDRRSLTTEIQVYPGEMAVIAGLDSQLYTTDNAGAGLEYLPPLLRSESDSATRMFILISAELQTLERRASLSSEIVTKLKGVLNAD